MDQIDREHSLELLRIALGKLDAFAESPAVPGIPVAIAITMALIPVVLAAFSRRMSVILGSLLLSALALVVFERPSLIAAAVSVTAVIASAALALSGIRARRRARLLDAKLSRIEEELTNLRMSDERRMLLELKAARRPEEPVSNESPES